MLPSDMAGGKFMTTRLSTLLSAALLIAASICGEPISAREFATKEEAIAMVKKAAALINEQGPDKAYTQFSSKSGPFHDRDLYITVLTSTVRFSHTVKGRISLVKCSSTSRILTECCS
jgi:hypothetical protein